VQGPTEPLPETPEEITAAGVEFWPLAMTRELDDAILHLTFNETDLGLWAFRTAGSVALVAKADRILLKNRQHWLINEILLFLRRTLKRIDLASRSLLAFIEPGSCFAGSLLELVLAADRSYMLDGSFESQDLPPATLQATAMNFGPLPMCNGLSRLETRFLGDADALDHVRERQGDALAAGAADELGLVTFIPDDLDWEDEVRIAVEERTSFSPDALTGMEASLRFPGPETLETKIFGRLSAWQNWIFQRPNAVGEEGALQLYGTGRRAKYNPQRV
jgi:benzoyl-CoA-dihydrodiol lyase